jgi:hypothetical protein
VVENPKNYIAMQKLTNKEEELMLYFWERGAMFVKDIVAIRKAMGLTVPAGQSLYNTSSFNGYRMPRGR